MPITKKLRAKVAPILSPEDIMEQLFALAAVCVLGATSIVWSFLGAHIQRGNADQLVNPYLFTDWGTFSGAIMPSAHTFLIKWPLFYLLGLSGLSPVVLTVCTVMICLATVGVLAYVIYRIERRPLMFGLLILALSSVLLLVPPQPMTGVLLPVNMAMITTRNLEYALYVVSLAMLIQAPKRLRSWNLWAAIGVLCLLIASDNLFFTLSVGGAIVAILTYLILKRWPLVRMSVVWLGSGAIASALAFGLLWLINVVGLTHVGSTATVSPYGLAQSIKGLGLGAIFGVMGLLTNLGANPAFDAISVKTVFSTMVGRLMGPYGVAFLVNFALVAVGAYSAVRLFWLQLPKKHKHLKAQPDPPIALSAMLLFSTIAAFAVFAVTNHYYVVDARYLTIVLFAVFVGAATFWRTKPLPTAKWRAGISAVLLCSIAVGVAFSIHIYDIDKDAHKTVDDRNQVIAQVLQKHPVGALVGDYWRVLPIKNIPSNSSMGIVPLEGCTKPRGVLTSNNWQKNYLTQSFAYLLSFDQKVSDFPDCTFDQVVAEYGRPNASFLVAGKLDSPKELLMFYDNGSRKSTPTIQTPTSSSSTLLPVVPDQLPHTSCPNNAPTIMNIVAHQDDDLLFLSPDLLHDIKAGHCVRTFYVTAGDAGGDKLYWLSRERGSEAAYATMLGLPENTVWVQRIVKLSTHQFVTVANPRGNAYVSLAFLHLPDGNLNGQGFKASHDESLERLEAGHVSVLHSVDGQSTYTSDDLVGVLSKFMTAYTPQEVHTQALRNAGHRFNDHSDHLAVGRYADRAFARYSGNAAAPVSIKYYIGYPIRERPQNVAGDDLLKKVSAFTTYGKFDDSVCHTWDRCKHVPTYGSYLQAQYTLAP